jgi:hypothetical protein
MIPATKIAVSNKPVAPMLETPARPLTGKMEVLQIMEDIYAEFEEFSTDTEPREVVVEFRSEAMARAIQRGLFEAFTIEAKLQEETVFAALTSSGEDETNFVVTAFCTLRQMGDAALNALAVCVDSDRQLIDAGLMSEWEKGPNRIPMEDYV